MAKCYDCKRTDVKCCPTCARDSYTCNVWHKCEEDCEGYEPRTQTNADRIRSMSDEELADFLCGVFDDDECDGKYICGITIPDYDEGNILEWLKSEAKE